MDRLFYMQEAIVDEVRKRPTPDNDELERANLLIAWFDKLEQDDEGSLRPLPGCDQVRESHTILTAKATFGSEPVP
jgi:hypothetical protein